MDFKDYYKTLGVAPTAPADEIKVAYRRLARKYHPDVSKEPDTQARFQDVAEAHEALIDPERRAAYDELVRRRARGESFVPPFPGGARSGSARGAPGGASGAEFSAFFEAMFGNGGGARARAGVGPDRHATLETDLRDAYLGARRTITLRTSSADASARAAAGERQLEVDIPVGVRPGQRLRLAGLGGPGPAGAPAGDLYLEIRLRPDPRFRIDGADVYTALPVAPWEAALGARVAAPTPAGSVEIDIPAGSVDGRKLRLKGQGLPGRPPGDLYAVIGIAWPKADTEAARAAYATLADAFPDHRPRHGN